ncbi:MAG: hypothetical protein J0L84_16070 [Verrucomicrobia bacterium]|nr:hypothetical protein [Verrucomicrobiota bacterium]
MYFWRVEGLKTDLATRPMSDREALPYLIAFVALSGAAAGGPPQETYSIWDWLQVGWSVALALFGTVYIYRRNGGERGQQFLQRYLALGWVVSIRWVVFLIPIIMLYAMVVWMGDTWQTTAPDALFFAAIEVVLYWRIGWHTHDLARRTAPSDLSTPDS